MAASGFEQQKDQNKDPKPTVKAVGKVVGPIMSHPLGRRPRKAFVTCLVMVVLVAAAGITWWRLQSGKPSSPQVTNTAAQSSLQSNLTKDLGAGNSQAAANDAISLINGKQSGKYTFSNADLAGYYMQAGSSFYNLKAYTKAASYYQEAPKYDRSVTEAALEGEVSAGYAAGQRSSLVPLLNQLVTLSAGQHDPMTASSAQYQADIQAIELGQEANL